MKLIDNWKCIVSKAWSIRLILLAGALTGLEVALPLFIDEMPRGVFAGLSMVASIGALWARITAQKNVSRETV